MSAGKNGLLNGSSFLCIKGIWIHGSRLYGANKPLLEASDRDTPGFLFLGLDIYPAEPS